MTTPEKSCTNCWHFKRFSHPRFVEIVGCCAFPPPPVYAVDYSATGQISNAIKRDEVEYFAESCEHYKGHL